MGLSTQLYINVRSWMIERVTLYWNWVADELIKKWYKPCGLMMGISPDYIVMKGLLGDGLLANREASSYSIGRISSDR